MSGGKKALITGGLGLIGSYIARQLIESAIVEQVICLDHYGRYTDSTRPDFHDYRNQRIAGLQEHVVIERGEAKYQSVMIRLLIQYKPEYILHLAALPLAKIGNLNTEEARAGTIDSTSTILESIGDLRETLHYCPERFVYASSSMVYGDFQSEAADETHPTNPKEVYGTMKLAGEVITNGLARYFRIPYAIVRPSAVYGPTDMNRRVSQIFIEKAFNGECIAVQGADEKLDFTYVRDIATGFVLAATHPAANGETFNVTYGQAHTLLDFVECLKKHFPDLQYEVLERDAFRPKRGTLSIAKARRLLGYQPDYPLQRGIDEYVEFIRRHHPRHMAQSGNS